MKSIMWFINMVLTWVGVLLLLIFAMADGCSKDFLVGSFIIWVYILCNFLVQLKEIRKV